ncbi:hypothetical protein Q8A67_024607 [Cirrhinus molitorella]|uniref:Chemokine interleukin-8-like domain-containing protein n=1 Tax=Cirrhinus molitorella TaxID=172907 RepID=A0AA88TKC0_9TELE|nr:hypothetical protein Q8A67_024607 [Cirrhinus molitorella]
METQRILLRTLAVAVVIASVIWTTTAAVESQKDAALQCCTKVSTAEVTDPIINIRLQHENMKRCVKAVIFETERGKFCCDPTQRWVQKKVKQFLRAQRNKHLASTPPPASTISHQTRDFRSACEIGRIVYFIIGSGGTSECCRSVVAMETQRILLRTLAVAVVIASVIWTTTAAVESQKDAALQCCTKVLTAEVTDPIINIRLQHENMKRCVKAVIFETERGEFCCDPKQRWVQKKVKQFFKPKNSN